MSRVEPRQEPKRAAEPRRRQPAGERRENKPSQAEGDERTVDEALRHVEDADGAHQR